MPCIRNDNGRAVPGAKGSCPIGSSWSDTADNNKFDWQDIETFAKRRYFGDDGKFRGGTAAMDAATGAFFIPGVGWVAGGAMKAGAKGIPWLIGRLFGKKVADKTKFIKPKIDPVTKRIIKGSTYGETIVPAGRAFSPLRSAATVGVGSQAVDYVAPFTERGIEAKKVRDANAAAIATKKTEDEAVIKSAAEVEAAKVQAEKDRVANLSFTEKMKEPGYWDEKDATGLTRIEKLGQLMTYFGKTPKQRAGSISPADRWAEMTTANAATAASIQKSMLADTPFSNIGMKGGMDIIKNLIQEEYGDKWYTWGAEKEEVEQITAIIYAEMVNLSKLYPGKSIMEYYDQAKKMYDERQEVA